MVKLTAVYHGQLRRNIIVHSVFFVIGSTNIKKLSIREVADHRKVVLKILYHLSTNTSKS